MALSARLTKLRDNYVINQVASARIPDFSPDQSVRYQVLFFGRVQHVGFRLEVCELAKRLALTGYCKNLEDGSVLVQLQGPENKILYLISFMESLKRIRIRKKQITRTEPIPDESGFRKEK